MRVSTSVFFALALSIVSQSGLAQQQSNKPAAPPEDDWAAFFATPNAVVPAPSASPSPAPTATPAPSTANPVKAVAVSNDPNFTFVEQCLSQTAILDKILRCEVRLEDDTSALTFTLNRARVIDVRATGQFGSFAKDFKVQRITHLHPRITGNGVVDESIRFYSENTLNTNRATMTVPCHQQDVAYVGIAKSGDLNLPEELVAACVIQ